MNRRDSYPSVHTVMQTVSQAIEAANSEEGHAYSRSHLRTAAAIEFHAAVAHLELAYLCLQRCDSVSELHERVERKKDDESPGSY